MANEQTNKMQYPKTTLELLKFILKKIPERLLKALPMTIAFGVFGWLFHTYLLVYVNEGFSESTWLGRNILNTKGNLISSTILWSMFGAIVPMLISFFKKGGNPIKSIGAMVKMPFDIINKSKTSATFLPYMCFACALTLFCERAFSGITSLVAGGIIMSSVVAFVTGRGSVFIQVLRMIVSDIQMFILKKQKLKLDSDSIFMIVGASGSILLIFGILRALKLPFFITLLLNYIWIVLIILGVVLIFNHNKVPKQFVFFVGFFGAAILFSRFTNLIVLADDGGWREAGGTLGGWIGSSGAGQATLSGLPPAIGGLIGSYVSGILGGLFNGFNPFGGGDVPVTPPPQDVQTTQDTPTTQDVPPTQPNVPTTNEETPEQKAERLKQEAEQERLRDEFEKKRQDELRIQNEIRDKALENKRRLEAEYAAHKQYEAMLCNKYNTTPDKLMDVLRANQGANVADAEKWADRASKLDYALKAAQITVIAADTAIDGLANVTGPYGKAVRAGYKTVKGVAVGAAEAAADGKSTYTGAASGLVKGAADAGSDYIDNAKVKAGLAIGSEILGGAITEGSEGAVKGLQNGIYNVGVGAITDKIGGGGYGNDTSLVNMAGGKTAVIINSGGQTITKIVSTNTAHNFIGNKLVNQGIQSGVKGASGLLNEFGAKPALTNAGVLPK